MASENSSVDTHPIFHKDPADHLLYAYKEVCIEAKDGTTHTGHVYTVDPVSESMVLVHMTNGKLSGLKVIMGHAIETVTVLDEDTDVHRKELDALFIMNMHSRVNSTDELKRCKNRLKSWLLKNRLPIEESTQRPDVLTLSDALFIEPPYGPDNCCSTNEIILGRVQGLIKNMPKDVDEW